MPGDLGQRPFRPANAARSGYDTFFGDRRNNAATITMIRQTRILIAGLSKTGTTALFYKILDSFPGQTLPLFEPDAPPQDDNTVTRNVVAKILLGPPSRLASFAHFERKIGIIRDPRDTLVSRLLYRMANHGLYLNDRSRIMEMHRLLQKKEESSESVSILDIVRLNERLSGGKESVAELIHQEWTRLIKIQKLVQDNRDFHSIKYEQLVLGDFAELENHLQFPLTGKGEVAEDLRRVVRTKSSGDWVNWFCEEDVNTFKPIYREFLDRNSYLLSWDLPEQRAVEPRFGSEFFLQSVERRLKHQ